MLFITSSKHMRLVGGGRWEVGGGFYRYRYYSAFIIIMSKTHGGRRGEGSGEGSGGGREVSIL